MMYDVNMYGSACMVQRDRDSWLHMCWMWEIRARAACSVVPQKGDEELRVRDKAGDKGETITGAI